MSLLQLARGTGSDSRLPAQVGPTTSSEVMPVRQRALASSQVAELGVRRSSSKVGSAHARSKH